MALQMGTGKSRRIYSEVWRRMQDNNCGNQCRKTKTFRYGSGCKATGLLVLEEQGFAHGDGVPDDFKHFLKMHPDMSFEEAKRRFKDEQKAKQQRKGPKLH